MIPPSPRPLSQSSVPDCENVSRVRDAQAVQAVVEAGLQPAAHAGNADAQRVHRDAELLGEGFAVADVAVPLMVLEHQLPLVRVQGREALTEAVEPAGPPAPAGHPRGGP